METVVVLNGRVGHIVSDILPNTEGRIVETVCGKTYKETELRSNEENLDVCSPCEKKFFNIVDDLDNETAPESLVDKAVEEPKVEKTRKPKTDEKPVEVESEDK